MNEEAGPSGRVPPNSQAFYRSVRQEAEAEFVTKKSRFIGHVAPAGSEGEAQAFIDRVASRHPQATHNVWAYRVGLSGERARCHDDGEPSGTAGRPVLEVAERQGLAQLALVVTRYFGGILLGAAGLVRAYAQAASIAIDAAGPVTWRSHARCRLVVAYPLSGRIPHLVGELGGRVEETTYTEHVAYVLSIESSREQRLMDAVRDATGGQAEIVRLSSQFRPAAPGLET